MEQDDSKRLDTLEDHAVRTESRLGVIEGTQRVHGDKLDQIVTAVTRYDARPVFDLHAWIRSACAVIGLTVAVGGAMSTLAVWLILTLTAATDKVVETELKYTKERLVETRELLRELANTTYRSKTVGN